MGYIEDINNLQERTVNAIHSDSIIKELLNEKIKVYQKSEISYLIKGTDIITVYPNETNKLLSKIDDKINNRISIIINNYLDLYNNNLIKNV